MRLLTEFEIQYLNPVHDGYPAWAGGERWLQLYDTGAETQIVMTEGLSDGNESLYEIYLESDDTIDPEDFSSSWQANLVYETGKVIPNVLNFADRIKLNTYLTLQIEMEGAPPEWSLEDTNGNIGLFIGLQNSLLPGLEKSAIALNIKLMRPKELSYGIHHDNAGRLRLAELYLQQGNTTMSNLERNSVV